jgi:hypothetical protein
MLWSEPLTGTKTHLDDYSLTFQSEARCRQRSLILFSLDGEAVMKAITIVVLTFLLLILFFSSIALHIEAFIVNGYQINADQITFPAILLPVSAAFRGHNISIALILAAALAGGVHQALFRRYAVERWHWLTEEEYEKVFRKK